MSGPVEVKVPRGVAGTFGPQTVKKRQRRLAGVDEMVLSLSAKRLTHGDISEHLAEVYGAEVSKQNHPGPLGGTEQGRRAERLDQAAASFRLRADAYDANETRTASQFS